MNENNNKWFQGSVTLTLQILQSCRENTTNIVNLHSSYCSLVLSFSYDMNSRINWDLIGKLPSTYWGIKQSHLSSIFFHAAWPHLKITSINKNCTKVKKKKSKMKWWRLTWLALDPIRSFKHLANVKIVEGCTGHVYHGPIGSAGGAIIEMFTDTCAALTA